MHLRQRGAGERCGVDNTEMTIQIRAECLVQAWQQRAERLRRGIVLQAGEGVDQLRRQQVAILRHDLADLHHRTFHLTERFGDFSADARVQLGFLRAAIGIVALPQALPAIACSMTADACGHAGQFQQALRGRA